MAKRRPRDLLLAAGFIVGTIGFGNGTTALAQGTIPGLTSTPITFSGHADAFVPGPDGNVWLVDYNANAIGRLAVDGSAYQAFAVPTAAAGVNSIAAGPDGNLWFTESSASKVGRITTSGAITEFPVPGSFQFVFPVLVATGSIASGPDGNLWISGRGQMARVSPQGAVTVVTVPPPQGVFGLSIGKCVVGSDNNFWCQSADTGTVDHTAKLTTSGAVTLYPGQGQSFDFVKGPDGNVWYVSQQQPFTPPFTLTRITPAGVETVYALPTQRDCEGLAVGADGNIWFT
jgi:streptogramin lyase